MKTIIKSLLMGAALVSLSSCNDYLEKQPESSLTPEAYFYAEADLSAYSINLYGNLTSISPGSYGISTFGNDAATDNQAAMSYSTRWVPGEWQVGSGTGNWSFTFVRNCNYFFEQVLPKYEAGEISGNETNIRHYIGEMYMLRAVAYFSLLQNLGDVPIILETLPDDQEVLLEYSVRRPRNKVARQILDDLSTAISYMAESGSNPGGKNRLTKDAAYILRSRVALYEGTFEKYHAGTAFVPGGKGWPGTDSEGYDNATEVNYFLTEAMASAKVVGDKLYGDLVNNTDTQEGMDENLNSINPYYTMFCDDDMDKYSEVAMWRDYSIDQSVTHNIEMQLERNGGGNGWTRGLVNSFVMRNGLPIYATGSGYDTEWEKQGVTATLQDRDSRIQIFTKRDGDVDYYGTNGASIWNMNWLVLGTSETRAVTGFAIKKGKHYEEDRAMNHAKGVSGSIIYRGTEALLNYMEACVEKNGSVDGTAANYWKALRRRAKVDEDYQKTINNTDMTKEAEGDWGAYSHGSLVSPLIYNVRRERRCELIGEGMRWADLVRWRACDQIKDYQIEGIRFWGSVYDVTAGDNDMNLSETQNGVTNKNIVVVDVDGGTGNMSDQSISGVYVRPYQISRKSNTVFNGYNFTPAHYLSPIGQKAFQNASPDGSIENSVVYQNPGWSKTAGEGPTTVE
jgi:hypothetical protein